MTSFQHALITGASSGIGRAIALELARGGTHLILAARREKELGELAEEIARTGARADVLVLDVANLEATRVAVERWDHDSGGLDLVLANAGLDQPRRPHKLDWPAVECVMQVNAMGALATLVPAVRPMVERGRGTLAAVTSVAGLRGMPGHAAYSASKAAVSTYLEALRVEVKPHGLRVVDIRPGFVDTPMTQKNRFPQPFMMRVEDAARLSVAALEKGTPIVTFPWQIAGAMAVAETMPDILWRNVARWLPR